MYYLKHTCEFCFIDLAKKIVDFEVVNSPSQICFYDLVKIVRFLRL
jgi:hypothetical protein